MHDFVADLGIDCPKILSYGKQENDVVPFPYLLQEKIKGKSLGHLYGKVMTHKHRVQIATQIGNICRKMTSQQYPAYGKLLSLGPVYVVKGGPITRDVRYLEPPWAIPKGLSKEHGVVQILQQGLKHWARTAPEAGVRIPWEKLCYIVQMLDEAGAFGSSTGWYFTHGDFYPRNIMADIDDEDNAKVTSVLDWDTASFQPAVIASRPPTWLWQWSFYCSQRCDEDNLDIISDMLPDTDEELEIKEAYDLAAGPEYCRIAYHPHAYTARKLALWAWLGSDNRIGHEWPYWVNWWVDLWESFEDHIRMNGFPGDSNGIRNPLYL
jgi:hypothetical protein